MNNKEFITALAARLDMPAQDAQKVLATFVNEFTDVLGEGCSLTVSGFGCFEVKKKLERIVVNPTTKQRMLVPPKLALSFKPSNLLKDKIKE